MKLTQEPSWIDPIVAYLKIDEQPKDKTEAITLRLKVARYVLYDDNLYRRGYSMPLLKCVIPSEAKYIIREIHEDICRNHAGGQSLAFQRPKAGLLLDSHEDRLHGVRLQMLQVLMICTNIESALKKLMSMTSPRPFAVWGINLIGRLPKGRGSV